MAWQQPERAKWRVQQLPAAPDSCSASQPQSILEPHVSKRQPGRPGQPSPCAPPAHTPPPWPWAAGRATPAARSCASRQVCGGVSGVAGWGGGHMCCARPRPPLASLRRHRWTACTACYTCTACTARTMVPRLTRSSGPGAPPGGSGGSSGPAHAGAAAAAAAAVCAWQNDVRQPSGQQNATTTTTTTTIAAAATPHTRLPRQGTTTTHTHLGCVERVHHPCQAAGHQVAVGVGGGAAAQAQAGRRGAACC